MDPMRACVAVIVLMLPLAVGAEVFRCTDSAGRVAYTDAPCPGGAGRTVNVHQNTLPAHDVREPMLMDENRRLRAEIQAARAKEGPLLPANVGRTQADLQAERSHSVECARARRNYEVAASSIQTDRKLDADEAAMYSACGMQAPDKTIVNVTTVYVARVHAAAGVVACHRHDCVHQRAVHRPVGSQHVPVGVGEMCAQFGFRRGC